MRSVKEVNVAQLEIDTAAVTQTAATVASASSTVSGGAVTVTAPASDPVSAAVSQTLQARCAAVTGYSSLAQSITQARGAMLTGSAHTYEEQEQLNAASLRAGGGGSSQSGPPPVAVPSLPTPTIPTVSAPQVGAPPTNGKDVARLLHGGPGPAGLYSAAQQMRAHATELQSAARQLQGSSAALSADWQAASGDQASQRIRELGQWYERHGEHATATATALESHADAYSRARSNTPTPQQFEDTESRLKQAAQANANPANMGRYAPVVSALQTELGGLHTKAMTQYADYARSAGNPSLVGPPLEPPPRPGSPFAGQSGHGEVDPAAWKKGDKRHYPIIRGPNGLGPSQPADGPGWVEIGPGSGNFVRPDELPDLKIKNPGDLGPSPFYDSNGNEHGWRELVPGSGAWVPDDEFPNAQIKPPGALGPFGHEEYLPGSGIWLPREDLIPDPRDPSPPGYGQTVPASFTQSTGGFAASMGDGWDDDPVTEAEQIAPPGWSQDYHGNWSPPVITPGGAMGGGSGGRAPI
ncbi:hypothetical protein B1790_32320 [Mycobacterium sp. AT1]|nr:hypothetical protein B1790_32320 [Mycobacterium sp. AT1]